MVKILGQRARVPRWIRDQVIALMVQNGCGYRRVGKMEVVAPAGADVSFRPNHPQPDFTAKGGETFRVSLLVNEDTCRRWTKTPQFKRVQEAYEAEYSAAIKHKARSGLEVVLDEMPRYVKGYRPALDEFGQPVIVDGRIRMEPVPSSSSVAAAQTLIASYTKLNPDTQQVQVEHSGQMRLTTPDLAAMEAETAALKAQLAALRDE